MTTKEISYRRLGEAIRVAFTADHDIFKFYDSSAPVKNIDDIVENIILKLSEYGEDVKCKEVYEKSELIGYYVFLDRQLISFSINIAYRKRKYLREFFGLIKKDLDNNFWCALYNRNVRAIKYLIKNQMIITSFDKLITRLNYS